MNEQQFYSYLSAKTSNVFKNSLIKRKQDELGYHWNYTICATPIQREKGLIFGINWGDTPDYNYEIKTSMPDGKDIHTFKFLRHSKHLLRNNLDINIDIPNFNYTNLYFFRSQNVNQLSDDDWQKSIPLFIEFIEYINPAWLLTIGSGNIRYIWEYNLIENTLNSYKHNSSNRAFYSYSGLFKGGKPLMIVPHPNAHIPSDVREFLWMDACNHFLIRKNPT